MQPAHSSRGGRRSRRVPSSSAGLPSPRTALRSTGISRSIETTRTFCSSRWTPRARTRQTTGTAPRRHHRRRRRDSHAACSRTRARCRSSYVRVLVSIANPTPPRRDRQRVDVPSSSPRQRVPQPPPLRLKRRQRTPDLVLRASAHAAALGERQPMPGVEPEARVRGRERRRPPRAPPRSRRQAPAARWRRSPSPRQRLSTAAGIAGGARSSSQTVTHAMFLLPAQSSRRCSHRLRTLQRSSRAGL